MKKRISNNMVKIRGIFTKNFEFDHEAYGEKFYINNLSSTRKSGTSDIIPIVISEKIIDTNLRWTDKKVSILGEFRSHKNHDDKSSKTTLYVFAKNIEDSDYLDNNFIFATGRLCELVKYKKTLSGREISQFTLEVKRHCNKLDYLPCVAWGRNAIFISHMQSGAKISIDGRIQSRNTDKIFAGETQKRVVCEVSARNIEEVYDDTAEEN